MSTATKIAAKKPTKPSEHPPVAEMVKAAITSLKEKKGSSLAAIKKYITGNYKGIDLVRVAPFIRRFLKKAVGDGTLEQIKGSFRLTAKAKTPKKEQKPAAKKATKTKKPAAKKSPKKAKAADKPKKAATKKPATKKSPKKAAKKTAEKKSAKPKTAKKPAAKKATKPAAKKVAKK